MGQMSFNILKRAQDLTQKGDKLGRFFQERNIDLQEVRKNPDYYEELIKQYSQTCIDEGLYEESKAHMENEFNKLCEFHRRNEAKLVEKFYNIARNMIEEEYKANKVE